MPVRYHLLSVLSVFSAWPVGGIVTPHTRLWDRMTVKHAWNAVPENWECLGHSPVDSTIDLYLALKPHHENALLDVLHEVSNPRHPKYGSYLSKQQVAELVAPSADTVELVNSWLEDHGVPLSSASTALGGNWLRVIDVPLSQANHILGASYQLYHHAETNDTVLRTVSYSLPEALHGHIQTVVPTTYFGSPRSQRVAQRVHPSGVSVAREKAGLSGELVTVLPSREVVWSGFTTPSYLRWLYKTIGYEPAAAAVGRNELGIVGFNRQYPSTRDLASFMKEFRTSGRDADYNVLQIKGGGYDPSDPGMEATLNVQIAEGIAYPTPITYYSTGGKKPTTDSDPYLNWLNYVLGLPEKSIPKTMSLSYGGYEYNFPPEYAGTLCNMFMRLGVLGVSVLFASGDWGVGEGSCLIRDETGRESVRFLPIFPASCPWVTSVGGTTSDSWASPEVAAKISGGGFSNYFPRPDYQDIVVPAFLDKLGNKHLDLYDPVGRGIPDIAAQALNFVVVLDGKYKGTSGTSGSAPIVASVIALLNDYQISKGRASLGFLNPWLYGDAGEGLNDITSGLNPGCGTVGFSAIDGWDPVTGLGTLDFRKLEKILDWQASLPAPDVPAPDAPPDAIN